MARQKIKKADIEQSMLAQLTFMGADQAHYKDLLGDYMALWSVKEKLIKDIKKRGIVYEDVSSAGHKMQKNNPSTKELIVVSRQMLTILEKLNLVTATANTGGGEDEKL